MSFKSTLLLAENNLANLIQVEQIICTALLKRYKICFGIFCNGL